ncbi:hypothetical protein CDAR_391 [Caerostris darwini]|uniref:Uncharacterized protein n=1 Tax=Caerostris darwini TaxID=1538125 RepID=A0AAV4UCC7_9ARAC|nr:hypothetical protein CDAR_391 [Caerostris darwini]
MPTDFICLLNPHSTQTTQTKHPAEANRHNGLTCFSPRQQSAVTVPQREYRIRKGFQARRKEAAHLFDKRAFLQFAAIQLVFSRRFTPFQPPCSPVLLLSA